MSEGDQKNVDKIEGMLKEAFAQGGFEACRKLKGLIREGQGWLGVGLELAAKLAFITSFPDRVSTELKRVSDFDTLSVSDLITRVRVFKGRSCGTCNQRTENSDTEARPTK